jgi:hypothetical protein
LKCHKFEESYKTIFPWPFLAFKKFVGVNAHFGILDWPTLGILESEIVKKKLG